MTLTDFLLARIAEDEAETLGHLDRYVQRARAECAAKRDMVREAIFWRDKRPHSPNAEAFARWLLQRMATIYADHPDFRPEWRA